MKDFKLHLNSEALAFKQRRAATRVRGGHIIEGKDNDGTLLFEHHTRPNGKAIEVTKIDGYGRLLGGEFDLHVEYNPDGTVKEMFELGNPPLSWKADKPSRKPDERGK